jgi:hypothetical protein
MNEMENGSGKTGTKADSGGTIAHKRRMVSGAKFGLPFLCLYIPLLLIVAFLTEKGYMRHYTSEIVGFAILIGFPIIIGVAGLIAGIQKGRPGIGVLALVLTPIGFFFALAARNRSSGKAAEPVPTDNPDSAK